jgi:hypothetical protein
MQRVQLQPSVAIYERNSHMSQSWHPDESDWGESVEGDTSAASCIVLDRPFIVPVIFPEIKEDAAVRGLHIVLTCSAYDDDEECAE